MANTSTSSSAASSRRARALGRGAAIALRARRRGRIGARGRRRRASIPTIRSGPTTTARSTPSKVVPIEDTNGYDFVVNTFGDAGRAARRARAERQHRRRSARFELVHQPHRPPRHDGRRRRQRPRPASTRVSLDGWVVSGGKSTGVQPGFRMTDPSGQLYQIEVDPPSNPELASGAEIIGTAFYHAIGYHTVEVYLAEIDRAALVISEKATIRDPLNGRRRRLKKSDLDEVFERAARRPDGRYRVLVSRFAPGKPLGNFRYYGTRPDDPNDIVAHEHRRELRGARVFGAWLNHDDSRGINSLDMLETADGQRVGQALHVRLRLDPRQRHRLRAASSPRQRIHLRAEARMADAGDARRSTSGRGCSSTIPTCRRRSAGSRPRRSTR